VPSAKRQAQATTIAARTACLRRISGIPGASSSKGSTIRWNTEWR
jgi:hypothetical protein